jgi:hypothetical protein
VISGIRLGPLAQDRCFAADHPENYKLPAGMTGINAGDLQAMQAGSGEALPADAGRNGHHEPWLQDTLADTGHDPS